MVLSQLICHARLQPGFSGAAAFSSVWLLQDHVAVKARFGVVTTVVPCTTPTWLLWCCCLVIHLVAAGLLSRHRMCQPTCTTGSTLSSGTSSGGLLLWMQTTFSTTSHTKAQ
jgi:hypothetical protein